MEEGVETKVSAARSSLEAGSGFAVARAVDVTAELESPSAKLGGNGLHGSTLPAEGVKWQIGRLIWQCTVAPNAEQEGGAKEGRSLVLLVPTKRWW